MKVGDLVRWNDRYGTTINDTHGLGIVVHIEDYHCATGQPIISPDNYQCNVWFAKSGELAQGLLVHYLTIVEEESNEAR
jgi:hypothetical protein